MQHKLICRAGSNFPMMIPFRSVKTTALNGRLQLLPVFRRHCAATTAVETAPSPSTTATRDPLDFTEGTVSKIYSVPSAEMKQVFPRGLSRGFSSQMECFKTAGWVLRSQSYEIMSQLKENSAENKFLLFGEDGSGKSTCLNQVVHWCWTAGWLVIHVPGVSFWAHSRKELRPSSRYPGTYDQPHEATIWLRNFRSVNAKILKNLHLSETKMWTKREQSDKGEEMGKVIEQGLRKPAIATDIVGVVLEEVLREQARQSTVQDGLKLLLAMDECNACFNPCAAGPNKCKHVQPQELNLIKYFRKFIPIDMFPGAVVLSLSRRKMYCYFAPTCSPLDVLGEEGMEELAGYKQIELDNFSQEEVENILQFYKDNKWITKGPFEKVKQEVWHLSGSNPAEICKLSSLF